MFNVRRVKGTNEDGEKCASLVEYVVAGRTGMLEMEEEEEGNACPTNQSFPQRTIDLVSSGNSGISPVLMESLWISGMKITELFFFKFDSFQVFSIQNLITKKTSRFSRLHAFKLWVWRYLGFQRSKYSLFNFQTSQVKFKTSSPDFSIKNAYSNHQIFNLQLCRLDFRMNFWTKYRNPIYPNSKLLVVGF